MKTAKQTGAENLSKPYLKAFITAKMEEIESHKIADAKEVLEYLTSVMRGEQTEDVVTNQGIFNDVPVSAKDRISAAKELLKRYPNADPVEQAKLKKLLADTRISEAKAKAMEDNGQDIELLLDKMMDNLAKEDIKHGAK